MKKAKLFVFAIGAMVALGSAVNTSVVAGPQGDDCGVAACGGGPSKCCQTFNARYYTRVN
ncbi:hypothetical protein [Aureibacter tunicatorum]|uniref:Uncharacterized protein n=1 Tax=Aureibacter tunicatorum TaxID=866807 RepID=A0AAE4BUZ8_9BACT|nr:hypothetical protein [Aureibacter tunicatorum]MDR6241347.1 hypothetical protein [Aureibacter tunicatorum]BDD03606.1 hypothetical protein AUTU_10890 [Aureibacter tunicatorum]